jgi:Na+/phosphate symporter
MVIYFSALVALIGLVLYFIATNPKVQELGRIMFWTGLLAFMLGAAGHAFSLPPGR